MGIISQVDYVFTTSRVFIYNLHGGSLYSTGIGFVESVRYNEFIITRDVLFVSFFFRVSLYVGKITERGLCVPWPAAAAEDDGELTFLSEGLDSSAR